MMGCVFVRASSKEEKLMMIGVVRKKFFKNDFLFVLLQSIAFTPIKYQAALRWTSMTVVVSYCIVLYCSLLHSHLVCMSPLLSEHRSKTYQTLETLLTDSTH